MKRFWTDVSARRVDTGWTIELDGRPLKTPARAALWLPTAQLAEAIADEWRDVGETIDPRAMPLTGLANAAVDRVGADCGAFAAGLARYAEADLLCYRAQGPNALLERQAGNWDPLLAWARRRYDVDFVVTSGIIHAAQPESTVSALSQAVSSLDAYRLAGLSPLITIGGSLVAALAVIEEAVTADQAWAAVSIDDHWQLEQWGSDTEAEAALANRRRDFMAAAEFLQLLD